MNAGVVRAPRSSWTSVRSMRPFSRCLACNAMPVPIGKGAVLSLWPPDVSQ